MDKPQNLPCPKCREMGKDKTGDHLFLLSDGETYICRTGYHPRIFYSYSEEYGGVEERKGKPYHKESKEDILQYPLVNFDLRGIKSKTFFKWETRYSVSQDKGEPEFLHFPIKNVKGEVIGFHTRGIKKKVFFNTPGIKGEEKRLYGNYEKGKRAVITEGHLDALSVYQILKEKYPDFEPCVYSTNNGTGDFKSVLNTLDTLKKYEKVLLCFDDDEPGELLTTKAARALGSRTYVMELGKYKDANEVLQAGKSKYLISSFFDADVFRPSGVVSLASIADKIIEPVEMGLTYPYEGLTNITYGLRRDRREIISIAAAPGGGKSLLVMTILKHLIFEHKEKVSLFPLEENPIITGKKLVGSVMGKSIHIPNCEYDKEEARGVLESINDYIYIFDHQGSKSWEEIESVIRYQSSLGIFYYIIDPLTALSAHLSSGEANEMLNRMLADLSTLVNSLNISIFLISHLNNSKSGKSHEEGGKVRGSEFTGSRAVWRWSTLMLGLSRNLLAEDEVERNTSILSVIKNRFSGDLGSINLFYNKDTSELKEIESRSCRNNAEDGGEF